MCLGAATVLANSESLYLCCVYGPVFEAAVIKEDL